mgnify:CR=1 FL=1
MSTMVYTFFTSGLLPLVTVKMKSARLPHCAEPEME